LNKSQIIESTHRHVIKSVSDESLSAIEIITRPNEHYGENALSYGPIDYCMKMVKLGSPNLSSSRPPGRETDEALPAVIAEAHARDYHLSVRAIDKVLNIAATRAHHYLMLSGCQTKGAHLCDNAPIDKTARVKVHTAFPESKRTKHPPHGPDLAPCDFCLFGYLREQLNDGLFTKRVNSKRSKSPGASSGLSSGCFNHVNRESAFLSLT
jgi:hypothetical protein